MGFRPGLIGDTMGWYFVKFDKHMTASFYVEADSPDGAGDIASMYVEDHVVFQEVDCVMSVSLDADYLKSGREG